MSNEIRPNDACVDTARTDGGRGAGAANGDSVDQRAQQNFQALRFGPPGMPQPPTPPGLPQMPTPPGLPPLPSPPGLGGDCSPPPACDDNQPPPACRPEPDPVVCRPEPEPIDCIEVPEPEPDVTCPVEPEPAPEPPVCGIEMTAEQAAETLLAEFDAFDGGDSANGVISREDLVSILTDPDATVAQKEAAAFMLANPEAFDNLDTAQHGGESDGLITRGDLENAVAMDRAESMDSGPDGITAEEATDILAENFDEIDAGDEANGLISREDLQQIMLDPEATPEQQAAAAHLLNNDAAFDQLDTAQHGGETDGQISLGDVDSAVSSRVDTTEEAADIIRENFREFDKADSGERDGKITRDDLVAMLQNPDATAEQKAAASHLLSNPDAFNELDVAHRGGEADGNISRNDLRTVVSDARAEEINSGPDAVTTEEAIEIINEDFGAFDANRHGNTNDHISKGNLRQVLLDPSTTPEQKAAAAHLLANDDAFAELASAGDSNNGTISQADIDAMVAEVTIDSADAAAEVINEDFAMFDSAATGEADGAISREDLVAMLQNPDATAEQKAAAAHLLTNVDSFDELDAGGADGLSDGQISESDIHSNCAQAEAEQMDEGPESITMDEALDILDENFEAFDSAGNEDGMIDRNDLVQVMMDDSATPEQKAAAAHLLANPDAFNELDAAGESDNGIGQGDIDAAVSERVDTTEEAAQVLSDNFDAFDSAATGSGDGSISREDLIAVLEDPEATAEQKAAATHLLCNVEAFDEIDGAGEEAGGITEADLDGALRESRMEAAAETIRNDFDSFDGADSANGVISRDDLVAVLENPDSTQEQIDAASLLLTDTEAFDDFDTAEHGGETDGLITEGDAEAATAGFEPLIEPDTTDTASPGSPF